MCNFTYPSWSTTMGWSLPQLGIFTNYFVVQNICGMESSYNLYLSPEAFWNAHLHTVAGEAEFPKIGICELLCTYAACWCCWSNSQICEDKYIKSWSSTTKHEATTRPSLELFFLTSIFNIFLYKKLTVST